MDTGILQDVGLTTNEAKVYCALLKLGSASVNEITRKSGVHRVNVYDVLERLLLKGLIGSIIVANKRHYEAANPSELLKLLEAKEQRLRTSLPSLHELYNSRREKEEVHCFKGPNGVMTAYFMMLDQGKTIYAIGASGLNRKYLKHRHIQWDKERITRGIHVKALYYESARKEKKEAQEQLWQNRFLPDTFKSPAMVDVSGDIVVILLATETILAIVIENKHIADTYRTYFDFMWQFAKD
ncbi:TrmB family transcriptional regulator [Candidatus Woesearchaeota archaeon]|nr:TrmB family transcriptional regulator [Candidatus Woesearchaeota archaeon]